MRLPFFLARRFVAGETFDQALPKIRELQSKDIKVAVDLLGENVTDRSTADQTVGDYCSLIEQIRESSIQAYLSIKLTMLGLDIDLSYCRENLFRLLDKTGDDGPIIRIDMEGSAYTQRTFELFYDALDRYPGRVGIVIQAYLHRTREDLQELLKRNADVRICKGAYKEPPEVASQYMADIRALFKEYTSMLLKGEGILRIATHDDLLIEWVKKHAREQNILKKSFEFQMLYGLRLNTCEHLVKEGYSVRVYVPFGTMWLPYYTRRLRERKENLWFILSTMFKR